MYGAEPKTARGAIAVVMTFAGATLVALLLAQFFPSIIPARATAVKL